VSTRNVLSTLRGSDRRKIHEQRHAGKSSASVNPSRGATTMKTSVLVQPLRMIAENPAFATGGAASANQRVEEDVAGRGYQVTRSR